MAILRALADDPHTLGELRSHAGAPPTTVRSYLRALTQAGVVERDGTDRGSGAGRYELSPSGDELLGVSRTLAGWLARAPEGPIELGTAEAKNAIKALADGWSAGMIRALAARPMSLTELDNVVVSVSYPALERRLTTMRLLGMVDAVPGGGRGTPYTVTAWLRGAVAPLAAATLWEHRHQLDQAPPITNRDVEAAFLLALPLLRLPEEPAGPCRLAVRMNSQRDLNGLVGVTAEVRAGRVVSCVTSLDLKVRAWAEGSPAGWISALVERDARRLELGGEPSLARNLVDELHRGLRLP